MADLREAEIRGLFQFEGEDYYREVPLELDLYLAENADSRFAKAAIRVVTEGTRERYRAILEDEPVQNASLS